MIHRKGFFHIPGKQLNYDAKKSALQDTHSQICAKIRENSNVCREGLLSLGQEAPAVETPHIEHDDKAQEGEAGIEKEKRRDAKLI